MFPDPLSCLVAAIYFEAAGEPFIGQVAVAQVVFERVSDPNYPDTICDVVTQGRYNRNGIPLRDRCHFSFWCDGRPENITDENAEAKATLAGIVGYLLPSITGHAIYYHEQSILPWWAPSTEITIQINNHVFRKEFP